MTKNQAAVPEGAAVKSEADAKAGTDRRGGKDAGKAMEDAQNAAGDGAAGVQTVSSGETVQERAFPLEVLRANCTRLFGCTSSTFDGAFFDADRKREYTVQEAKERIWAWEGKEIDG